jgi:hypothetical protein
MRVFHQKSQSSGHMTNKMEKEFEIPDKLHQEGVTLVQSKCKKCELAMRTGHQKL